MSQLKTTPNDDSVGAFLETVDQTRQDDCDRILQLMRDITGEEPKMWGKSIIGFGKYHYKYASGREGDWFLTGFSPRKRNLSLYIMSGFDRYEALMEKLGKYKTGKSCLYVKKLEDIDTAVLKELIEASVTHLREKYGTDE